MDATLDSEPSRLWSLVGDLLLPFTESNVVSLTKEREKDLLLALSKVMREVEAITSNNWACSRDEDYQNLVNITSHLMILLTFNSQYVRHLTSTVLVSISQFLVNSVLMTRLSFQSCLDCSVLVSWLQHLHDYFEEILYLPMTSLEYHTNCLEDSPFLLNNIDGDVSSIRSCHLQRQAIFLLLRCSLSLINMKEDTDMCSFNGTACSSLVWEAALDGASCSKQKGLLQLYAWIRHCLELEKYLNHEVHVEKLIGFVTSLLKLYIHEDDLLFRLLLLLLSVPFCERQFNRGYLPSHDIHERVLILVSTVFNPIRLFILFLAELHYDHQVVLDYLISRDTGISCAEYLLRCLRKVCDSWQEFLLLSGEIELINKSPSKRRKTSADSSNFESVSPCRPMKNFQINQSKDESGDCSKRTGSEEGGNVGIRDCLLSLKKSLENLHCKQLFPYNPGLLLKRLTTFQKLCWE